MNGPRLGRAAVTLLLTAGLSPTTIAAASAGMTDELAPLAWFVGAWQCAGQFSNRRPIHSRETFSTEMGGHWLRMQHADTLQDHYAADEWWGYDRATREFAVTVFDNTGGLRNYVSSGWAGTTLSLLKTAGSGYIDRFVFRRSSNAQYRISYAHLDSSGAWQPDDEPTCRRDVGPPACVGDCANAGTGRRTFRHIRLSTGTGTLRA